MRKLVTPEGVNPHPVNGYHSRCETVSRALSRTSSSRPQATIVPRPSTATACGMACTANRPKRSPQALDAVPRRDVDADRVVEVEFVHHLLDRLGVAARRVDADDRSGRSPSRPWWSRLSWGRSLRQGPHHSAQKSRITTLPRSDAQVRGLPLSQVAPGGKLRRGLADEGVDGPLAGLLLLVADLRLGTSELDNGQA